MHALSRRRRQAQLFAQSRVLFHLADRGEAVERAALALHFGWTACFTQRVLAALCKEGMICDESEIIQLTERGHAQRELDRVLLFQK